MTIGIAVQGEKGLRMKRQEGSRGKNKINFRANKILVPRVLCLKHWPCGGAGLMTSALRAGRLQVRSEGHWQSCVNV